MTSTTDRPRRPEWPRWAAAGLSLVALLGLWSLGALIEGGRDLPSPWRVGALMVREAESGRLFHHIWATLQRVILAFVISMAIGSAIGLAMGRMRGVNRFFDLWLIAFLNLPALVTMVLCYVWIGLNETAAIVAVAVNKIPLVAAMMREGARAMDPALDDLAKVFRMSPWRRLIHVTLPQLAPHFAASARAGIALIWKIVLVVELLGRSNGVGFQIHFYFADFAIDKILVYALSFVLVMLAIELLLMQPIERRARRWRAP